MNFIVKGFKTAEEEMAASFRDVCLTAVHFLGIAFVFGFEKLLHVLGVNPELLWILQKLSDWTTTGVTSMLFLTILLRAFNQLRTAKRNE